MRWFVVAAISICALIASAFVLYGVATGPLRMFTNLAGREPMAVPRGPEAEGDFGSRAPVAPPAFAFPEGISEEQHPAPSERPHEALRRSEGAKTSARIEGPEPLPSPQRAGEVDGLAKRLAPAMAREALDLSAQKSPVMPEVEHELLETWKEQKQILAGHRDTIDTVLQEAQ